MERVPVTIIYNDKLFTFNQQQRRNCKYIAKSIELKGDDEIVYTHTYSTHVSVKHYHSRSDYEKYRELFLGMDNA